VSLELPTEALQLAFSEVSAVVARLEVVTLVYYLGVLLRNVLMLRLDNLVGVCLARRHVRDTLETR